VKKLFLMDKRLLNHVKCYFVSHEVLCKSLVVSSLTKLYFKASSLFQLLLCIPGMNSIMLYVGHEICDTWRLDADEFDRRFTLGAHRVLGVSVQVLPQNLTNFVPSLVMLLSIATW